MIRPTQLLGLINLWGVEDVGQSRSDFPLYLLKEKESDSMGFVGFRNVAKTACSSHCNNAAMSGHWKCPS